MISIIIIYLGTILWYQKWNPWNISNFCSASRILNVSHVYLSLWSHSNIRNIDITKYFEVNHFPMYNAHVNRIKMPHFDKNFSQEAINVNTNQNQMDHLPLISILYLGNDRTVKWITLRDRVWNVAVHEKLKVEELFLRIERS